MAEKKKYDTKERLEKESPWFSTRKGKSVAEIYYICLAQFLVAAGEYNQVDGLYRMRHASSLSNDVKTVLSKYYENDWGNVAKTFHSSRALLQSSVAALASYCEELHIPFANPLDYVDSANWDIINEFYGMAIARTRFTGFREAMLGRIETQYNLAVEARKAGEKFRPYTPDELIAQWRNDSKD